MRDRFLPKFDSKPMKIIIEFPIASGILFEWSCKTRDLAMRLPQSGLWCFSEHKVSPPANYGAQLSSPVPNPAKPSDLLGTAVI